MHEMSLCEGIVQILEEQAAIQHYTRVRRVWMEIGQLSGIEIEALRFSFDVVCRDTLAEGAKLDIIEVPGQAWCLPCARTITVSQRHDPCPKCGSYQIQVTGGDEMRIKELEVD